MTVYWAKDPERIPPKNQIPRVEELCHRDLCLNLLLISTYYAPPPPEDRFWLMRSPGATALLTFCYLPMLRCLFLLCACGLYLCPLVSWSVICCKDGCSMVRQRHITEKYLISTSTAWRTRARGGEGALSPSCRAPQGHDQISGDLFFFIHLFSKFRLAAAASRHI